MQRTAITKKAYSTRRQQAALAAVERARVTILNSRRNTFGAPAFRGRGPELKTIDVTAFAAFATAGAVALLNGVATGSDYNTRVGRKIRMKSLLFKFSPYINAAVPNGDVIRVMIVYDNQSNAAAPTVANILQQAQWDSPINLDNRDRFKVIVDKFLPIDAFNYAAGAITTGSFTPATINEYRKLNMDSQFSGTGATIASINTGSVYLLTISQNGSGVGYYYNSRIRFLDA